MLNLQDFISKYNGQENVGNTPDNKGECTGLVQVWLQEQGLEHVWGHAKDLLVNASPDVYEVIKNTPDAVPEAGDCIVWTAGFNNTYGHTAIVVKGNVKTFEVFEQNNPLGSPCRLHTYPDYAYVDGWFRKRVIIAKPTAMNDQTIIPNELTGWITGDDNKGLEIQQIRGMLKEFSIVKVDLQNTRKALEDADLLIEELNEKVSGLQKDLEDEMNLNVRLANKVETPPQTAPGRSISPDSFTLKELIIALLNKIFG